MDHARGEPRARAVPAADRTRPTDGGSDSGTEAGTDAGTDAARPVRARLSSVQLILGVSGVLVGVGLLLAAVLLFVIAGTPWGPCDPGGPDCGPSRGSFIGASFLTGVLGALVLGAVVTWLVRRWRPRD